MGLFFMISGYFIPGSYDRHGSKKFIKERFIRYGIPLLFTFFILSPLEEYFYYVNYSGMLNIDFINYYISIFLGISKTPEGFIKNLVFLNIPFGPLWFVEHLLIYSIIYCGFRVIFKNTVIKNYSSKIGLGTH